MKPLLHLLTLHQYLGCKMCYVIRSEIGVSIKISCTKYNPAHNLIGHTKLFTAQHRAAV